MEMAFRECVREAKERGQSVFLSSHIISEVEALWRCVGSITHATAGSVRGGDAGPRSCVRERSDAAS
jgi:ABC-type multidrug transport system ATPase subunit